MRTVIYVLFGSLPLTVFPSLVEAREPTPAALATDFTIPADNPTPTEDRWINRHAPYRNAGEIGAFGGTYLPSPDHELFQPNPDAIDGGYTGLRTASGAVGARVGYYPSRFLGIEAEGGASPTRTAGDDRATLWNVRGNLVGQLGLWSVVPFVLAGTGALGVASDANALGNDVDLAFHFGGGVKVNTTDRFQIRLDLRDVLAAQRGVADGVSHNGEILLGAVVRLGRAPEPKREPEPEPAPVAVEPPGDRDADGFLDPDDACPDVPGSEPDGCPRLDRDRDGFLDDVDACPDEPGVEPDGCPLRDADDDGILDPDDACPEVAENRNGFEDTDGCPDELPEEVRAFTGVIEGIHFDVDRASIRASSQPVLDRAVRVLAKYPELSVEISGHTDSTGGYRHNLELSAARAAAVAQYLTEQGIAAGRLSTRGAGPDEPLADNSTKRGRQQNRRIEFKVLEGGTPSVKAQPASSL